MLLVASVQAAAIQVALVAVVAPGSARVRAIGLETTFLLAQLGGFASAVVVLLIQVTRHFV